METNGSARGFQHIKGNRAVIDIVWGPMRGGVLGSNWMKISMPTILVLVVRHVDEVRLSGAA